MRRWILWLVSLSLLFGLTGCSDTAPLKEKLIIEGIGVDYAENRFEVTLQVYAPSTEGVSKKGYQTFSAVGETLYQALRLVDENTGKYSYYSDTKVVVFSLDALQKGLWNNVEYFVRSSEMGSNVALAATRGRAADLLTVEGEGNNIPARVLSNALHYGKSDVGPISGELMTVSAMLVNDWGEVSLPMLAVEKKEGKGYPYFDGVLCFHQDTPQYQMTEQEKWVYNWMHEYYDDRAFVLPYDNHLYALQIRDSKRKIKVYVDKDVPVFTVSLTLTCDIMETNSAHGVVLTDLEDLKTKMEETVSNLTRSTLQQVAVTQQCDVFDLGRTLRKQHHDFVRRAGDLSTALKNSRFECITEVIIARAGQGSVDE
ncbi:MAG: Ger(x)C family spore germination protein [Clostridia bacterium]|nr:Ger(x)C family spore germination protein [Clostridia bacterium]